MRTRHSRNWRFRVASLGMVLFAVLGLTGPTQFASNGRHDPTPLVAEEEIDFTAFEAHLETIRQALKIPGMSAAVVRDQELIWAKGFGFADLEKRVPAAPDTPYGLASVTKPVAAVLIMQLVQEDTIDLDAPIAQYGVHVLGDAITVRHLLTHTSEGAPGTVHNYNGNRYGLLGGVIEGATGKTFAELLSERVLLPLDMRSTALNPFDSWGSSASSDLFTFSRSLGWRAAYRHYPDVYRRLAKPYQFSAAYDLIPGMYHLYHSPAAGLISSVTDLAAFDIALDQGLLLEDSTKAEMFAPAVSTYNNRSDLQYGLGWYVQDFDGLQLRWHTGRWPPSTSALYLRVPQLDLTFIVLANTDNLTVPFYSIGFGNVMTSTLALSFYRHFVFPGQHDTSLPDVDWSQSEEELVGKLSGEKEGSARQFLERELWSFRQAYASIGRHDQAEKLWRISVRAFPRSMMRSDPMLTNLPGDVAVVAPTVSAVAYHWISVGIALWFATVAVSWLGLFASLVRTPGIPTGSKVWWLIGALFLGPLALGAYRLACLSPRTGSPPEWRQALEASVSTITAYTIGWALAITVLRRLGEQRHPLAILGVSYLTPLLTSLLCLRAPSWFSACRTRLGRRIAHGLVAEIALLNIGFAVLFPLTMVIGERVLTTIPSVTSPFFWAMLSFTAAVGIIGLVPLHYWMIRHGCTSLAGLASDGTGSVSLPDLRTIWPALLATLSMMVAALAVTIGQLS